MDAAQSVGLAQASETTRLRLAVARLARQLRQHNGDGLTPTQHSALATIGREGPMTLGRLSEIEQVAPPSVTRVVDKLCDQGVVERKADVSDRRVTRVAVTDLGRALLAESRERKVAWFEARVADLDSTTRSKIADAVEVLELLVGETR